MKTQKAKTKDKLQNKDRAILKQPSLFFNPTTWSFKWFGYAIQINLITLSFIESWNFFHIQLQYHTTPMRYIAENN